MNILKHLAEPFRKIDEVIKNRSGDEIYRNDEEPVIHVTRITGLRSMFINKLSSDVATPRLRRA